MHVDQQPLLDLLESPSLLVLNPHERIPEEIDTWLAQLAYEAQRGNRQARNAIYLVLQPRFGPIFWRIRSSVLWREREGRSWTFEDLEQEAFLIACELIENWPGGNGIAGYLFIRLPWRLRDTLRRWSLTAKHEGPMLPIGLPADDAIDVAEVRMELEDIFRRLSGSAAEVLRMRVVDGLRDEAIAERLGVSVRTVRRRRQSAYRLARAIYLGEMHEHGSQ